MDKIAESEKVIVPLPTDDAVYFPTCLIKMPGQLVKLYGCLLSLNNGDFFEVQIDSRWRLSRRQLRTNLQDLATMGLIETRAAAGRRTMARILPLAWREPERLPHREHNREVVRERDRGICRYCGDPATEFEHVIPRSRGGTDHANNVVMSCRPCNLHKGPRTPEEAGMVLRPAPEV